MRFVLALLSSFLLLNAQIYAIPAGPVFDTGSGGGSVVGTYSGVLIPTTSDPTTTSESTNTDAGLENSLGLFTLSLPSTGLGTGTVTIFSEGRTFAGTITAFGDPDSGDISGVVAAVYTYSIAVSSRSADGTVTFVTQAYIVNLSGRLNATVGGSSASGFGRITGTSVVQVSSSIDTTNGEAIIDSTQTFIVEGVQGSNAG